MINRRKFLASSIVSAGVIVVPRGIGFSLGQALPVKSETGAAETRITVLHTNDTHSQIDPLPPNDKYAGKGGVGRRATLVKQVRKENPNTLLLDGGDVVQGTPYFNFYKGEVEYKAMSVIGYDAGTIGNHEFDNGVDALAAALKFANFDLVSSNYDVKGTTLEGLIKPYVVKSVGGIRVGLLGLGISPVALITSANFKGITYLDPVLVARDTVIKLRKQERCALVICMSHLGYYDNPRSNRIGDSQVAAQVDGIDYIVSGHTHTFMEQPVKQRQPCGAETLIFQVGKSGIYIGRADFTFRSGKLTSAQARLVDLRNLNV